MTPAVVFAVLAYVCAIASSEPGITGLDALGWVCLLIATVLALIEDSQMDDPA